MKINSFCMQLQFYHNQKYSYLISYHEKIVVSSGRSTLLPGTTYIQIFMKIVTNEIQITDRNGGTGGFVDGVLGKKPFIFMWIQVFRNHLAGHIITIYSILFVSFLLSVGKTNLKYIYRQHKIFLINYTCPFVFQIKN